MMNKELALFKTLIEDSQINQGRKFFDFDSFLYASSVMDDFSVMEDYLFRYNAKKILDTGVGVGLTSWYLCRKGFEVTASDIEISRHKYNMDVEYDQSALWKNIQVACPGLKFVEVPRNKMPFGDGEFDALISFAVLEHVEPGSLNQWLDESARVLKKNGLFLLFKCPQKTSLSENLCRKLGIGAHDMLFSKKEITMLFEKRGFRELYSKIEDFFPYFLKPYFIQKAYDLIGPFLRQLDRLICLTPIKFFAHNIECVYVKD